MLPGGGFKIAKVFGIEIDINPTWLIIFALVGVSLSETMRGAGWPGHPGRFPAGVWPWVFGFGTAIVFFACLLAHELSHSYVAKRKGINIRRITLFLFGGVAEMSEDVSDATSELEMAAAGPAMTFFLAGVFYLLFRVVSANPNRGPLWIIPLWLLVYINLFIGVFNLLPAFRWTAAGSSAPSCGKSRATCRRPPGSRPTAVKSWACCLPQEDSFWSSSTRF